MKIKSAYDQPALHLQDVDLPNSAAQKGKCHVLSSSVGKARLPYTLLSKMNHS